MIKKNWFLSIVTPLVFLFNVSVQAFHNWEPPVNLNNGTTISIQLAKIVCDPIGNGAAVWFDSSGTGQAGMSFRPVNGIWESAVYFPTNGLKNFVDITMDEAGNVTAFYVEGITLSNLYAVYRPAGATTWGTPTLIYSVPTTIQILQLHSSSTSTNTQAIVAFVETSSGNIINTLYRSGTTWSGVSQASVSGTAFTSFGLRPRVHMLSNGNAQIVMALNPGTMDLFFNQTTSPGIWSGTQTPLNVATLGSGNTNAFDFDINGNGSDAVVITTQGNTEAYTVARVGGAWQTPYQQTSGPAQNPGIGLSDGNIVGATWEFANTPIAGIGTLNTPLTQTSLSSSGNINFPVVDVSPNGNMLFAWIDDVTDQVVARFGAGTTLESNASVLGNIASKPLLYNVCVNDNNVGWAIWEDGPAVIADRTYDPAENLLKLLGEKRLIYQKGLFP